MQSSCMFWYEVRRLVTTAYAKTQVELRLENTFPFRHHANPRANKTPIRVPIANPMSPIKTPVGTKS